MRLSRLFLVPAAGLIPLYSAIAQTVSYDSMKQPGTYYVSTQGNDNNPGTKAQPWRTIEFAVKEARAPGDIILVEDGTYQGPVSMKNSGAPGAHITLKAVNKWGARIKVSDGAGDTDGVKTLGNYLTVDGFEIYDSAPGSGHYGNGITIFQNHHINILNNKIHDFGGSGIQAVHFDHVLLENNFVYNNAKYDPSQTSGISLYQARAVDNASGYHAIVRNNRSYGNMNLATTSEGRTRDGNGILIDDFWNSTGSTSNVIFPHRTLIENNLSYNNGGKGIQVFKSSHVDVFNNTAYHNNHDKQNTGTWRAELSHAWADDTVWRNNIGVAKAGSGVLAWNRAILIAKGGDTVWENNITYSGAPGEISVQIDDGEVTENYLLANNLLGLDPHFADAVNRDFSLKSLSPAINAGTDKIVSFHDINYLTRPRDAIDIGAFEFDGSQPVGSTPSDDADADGYLLAQSYPNPFYMQTRIGYTLPAANHVTLEVFDLLGRRIRSLVSEEQAAGVYTVTFDARDLPAGAYVYRLTAGAFSKTKTMVLLR